jgi:hypothetical protein
MELYDYTENIAAKTKNIGADGAGNTTKRKHATREIV